MEEGAVSGSKSPLSLKSWGSIVGKAQEMLSQPCTHPKALFSGSEMETSAGLTLL